MSRCLWIGLLLSIALLAAACDTRINYTGIPGDADVSDGDLADGDFPDGDFPDGDFPDGDGIDGDATDGDTIDGDFECQPDPGDCYSGCVGNIAIVCEVRLDEHNCPYQHQQQEDCGDLGCVYNASLGKPVCRAPDGDADCEYPEPGCVDYCAGTVAHRCERRTDENGCLYNYWSEEACTGGECKINQDGEVFCTAVDGDADDDDICFGQPQPCYEFCNENVAMTCRSWQDEDGCWQWEYVSVACHSSESCVYNAVLDKAECKVIVVDGDDDQDADCPPVPTNCVDYCDGNTAYHCEGLIDEFGCGYNSWTSDDCTGGTCIMDDATEASRCEFADGDVDDDGGCLSEPPQCRSYCLSDTAMQCNVYEDLDGCWHLDYSERECSDPAVCVVDPLSNLAYCFVDPVDGDDDGGCEPVPDCTSYCENDIAWQCEYWQDTLGCWHLEEYYEECGSAAECSLDAVNNEAFCVAVDGDVVDGDADEDGIDGDDEPGPCRYYVQPDADPIGADGLSWATAYNVLQPALNDAYTNRPDGGICEVWVAEGRYEVCVACSTDSVQMRHGVHIYGSLPYGADDVSDRSLTKFPTTLSGGQVGGETQVYHVVRGDAENGLLDSFILEGGEAVGDGDHANGGGLLVTQGSSTFRNLIIRDNFAVGKGSAVYVNRAIANFENCVIDTNLATAKAGGIVTIESADVTFSDSIFLNNDGDIVLYSINTATASSDLTLQRVSVTNNRFVTSLSVSAPSGYLVYLKQTTFDISELSLQANEASRVVLSAENSEGHISDSQIVNNAVVRVDDTASSIFPVAAFSGSAPQSLDIQNCSFRGNSSISQAALSVTGSLDTRISNCQFVKNSSNSGPGALQYSNTGSNGGLLLEESIFIGNRGGGNGGAMALIGSLGGDAPVRLEKVVASGNYAGLDGGAIHMQYVLSSRLHNVELVRNQAARYGGAIAAKDTLLRLSDATLTANLSSRGGRGLFLQRGYLAVMPVAIVNSILWDNATDEILLSPTADSVQVEQSYSINIDSNWGGDYVSHANPLFETYEISSGQWETVHYASSSDKTTFFATTGAFRDLPTGGIYLRLANDDWRWLPLGYGICQVFSNDGSAYIEVKGDWREMASAGDSWRLYGTRLSTASPAIDAAYGYFPEGFPEDIDGQGVWDHPNHANVFDCADEPGCWEYADIGAREYTASYTYPPGDDFESGDTRYWQPTSQYVHAAEISRNWQSQFLQLERTSGESDHGGGLYQDFLNAPIQPCRISYKVKVDWCPDENEGACYLLMRNSDNELNFYHWFSDGYIRNSQAYLTTCEPDHWYVFQYSIDWVSMSYSLSLDGERILGDIALPGSSPYDIASIELYNYSSGYVASYDDIVFETDCD